MTVVTTDGFAGRCGVTVSACANCFAGRPGRIESFYFSCADRNNAATGAPLLHDAIGNFDCTVDCTYLAGTHHIFIGRAVEVWRSERAPLAFSNRDYRALRALDAQCDRNTKQ